MMQVRRDVDRMLLVGLPLLALVAGIGGWWLTGRTLQPVHAMAGAADAIAHAGGAGRLPILTPHDELGRLGLRFNLLLDQLAAALAQQRRFLADADRALTYLHGRASPIVHRDIKPRNVVRRPNGSYVIVDFGAVSELIHRRGGNSTVVGTMGYMAPEQFQGRALPATDIYAVGATALALLTGADPDTLPHQGLKIDVRAAVGSRVSPTMATSLEQMLEPDRTGVHNKGESRPPWALIIVIMLLLAAGAAVAVVFAMG